MRTFRLLAFGLTILGALPGVALAFDGTPSPTQINPIEAAREGTLAFRAGNLPEAIAAWTPRGNDYNAGALWRYARNVGPASKGAVTHPGAKAETHIFADI